MRELLRMHFVIKFTLEFPGSIEAEVLGHASIPTEYMIHTHPRLPNKKQDKAQRASEDSFYPPPSPISHKNPNNSCAGQNTRAKNKTQLWTPLSVNFSIIGIQ